MKKIFAPALFLIFGISSYATSITVTSSISPSSVQEFGQTLAYAGSNPSATIGGPAVNLGTFNSTPSTNTTSNNFSLLVNSLTFTVDATAGGSIGSPADVLTFVGTGTENVGGVQYATVQSGGDIFGVCIADAVTGICSSSGEVNYGKGTAISVLVTALPEPGTNLMAGLGMGLLLVMILWRRRQQAVRTR